MRAAKKTARSRFTLDINNGSASFGGYPVIQRYLTISMANGVACQLRGSVALRDLQPQE